MLGKVSEGLDGVHLKNLHGVAVYVSAKCIPVLWRPNPEWVEWWSKKQKSMNLAMVGQGPPGHFFLASWVGWPQALTWIGVL